MGIPRLLGVVGVVVIAMTMAACGGAAAPPLSTAPSSATPPSASPSVATSPSAAPPTEMPAELSPPADEQPFCRAFTDMFIASDCLDRAEADAAYLAVLEQAPPELTGTADALGAAIEAGTDTPTPAQQAALVDLTLWIDRECVAVLSFGERIAPVEAPAGFASCGNVGWVRGLIPAAPEGWAVIYGDETVDDPYAGRLVAVLTGMTLDPGDGPRGQASVNGRPAVTGPPACSSRSEAGPYIAAWQESDDIAVWISAIGNSTDRQTVIDVAMASVLLSDDEWAAVSATDDGCVGGGP